MRIKAFFEAMFFQPKWYHYGVMVVLFPLSMLYGSMMFMRRMLTQKKHFSLPIVSVGNLQVGGSGKTPFVIAVASRYEGVCIVSRGYGRQSQGLVEVSYKGKILVTVQESGDEPMLMAKSLPNASVIVCEERSLGIELAMRQGAKMVLLDDGFNRVNIEKFEILLEPVCQPNTLPFPAGAMREFAWTKRYASLVLKEQKEFKRVVGYENLTSAMLLVTAIANPQRLQAYLPKGVVGYFYLEDHAYFNEAQLKEKMHACGATALLVTQKDLVKMEDFTLPLAVMTLTLEIDEEVFQDIDAYCQSI